MSLNSFEDQDTCLSRNFEWACIVDNNYTVFILLFWIKQSWWNKVVHFCRNSQAATFATEQSKLVIVHIASVTHTQLSK